MILHEKVCDAPKTETSLQQEYIQEAISELCKGKTLLVIAHRLHTIRNADQILVIENGRIAQSGTHDALMGQDGIYQNFIKKQCR